MSLLQVVLFILLDNSPKRFLELLSTKKMVVINKSPYALQTVDFLTSVVYPPVEVVKTVRCFGSGVTGRSA